MAYQFRRCCDSPASPKHEHIPGCVHREVQDRYLAQIPKIDQTQASLDDQLKILHAVANRIGLYDAADFIKERIY